MNESKVFAITVVSDDNLTAKTFEIVSTSLWGALNLFRKENPELARKANEVRIGEVEVCTRPRVEGMGIAEPGWSSFNDKNNP